MNSTYQLISNNSNFKIINEEQILIDQIYVSCSFYRNKIQPNTTYVNTTTNLIFGTNPTVNAYSFPYYQQTDPNFLAHLCILFGENKYFVASEFVSENSYRTFEELTLKHMSRIIEEYDKRSKALKLEIMYDKYKNELKLNDEQMLNVIERGLKGLSCVK